MYHKATHTDQYLQWDSPHNLFAKYSVRGTLTKIVCTGPELFNEELQHLREAMVKCKYPRWAIQKVQSKYINSNQEDVGVNSNQEGNPVQGTYSSNSSTEKRASRPHSHPIHPRTGGKLPGDL